MKRRKTMRKQTKGFFGTASRGYKKARTAIMRALRYSYRDRRVRKREMRSLWITRINAACRICGGSYSRFIDSLKKKDVVLDRKVLAHIAATDLDGFKAIYDQAKRN
jgi:large subunit ribosomal protein L20